MMKCSHLFLRIHACTALCRTSEKNTDITVIHLIEKLLLLFSRIIIMYKCYLIFRHSPAHKLVFYVIIYVEFLWWDILNIRHKEFLKQFGRIGIIKFAVFIYSSLWIYFTIIGIRPADHNNVTLCKLVLLFWRMLINVAFHIGKCVYILRIILIAIAQTYLFSCYGISGLGFCIMTIHLKSVLPCITFGCWHIAENALRTAFISCSTVNIIYIVYVEIYLWIGIVGNSRVNKPLVKSDFSSVICYNKHIIITGIHIPVTNSRSSLGKWLYKSFLCLWRLCHHLMEVRFRLFKIKGISCANIRTLLEHSHKFGKIRKLCKTCFQLIFSVRFRF